MERKFTSTQGAAAVVSAIVLAALTVLAGGPSTSTDFYMAADTGGTAVMKAAERASERRIVISKEERFLWLVDGQDTLFAAPVAIGKGTTFKHGDQVHHFETPTGVLKILQKEVDPVWTPPSWHYYEKAARRGLEVVEMERGEKYMLSDSTYLEVRGDQAGRVNQFGNFWPWTPGREMIFDGKIFVPPFGTAQRDIPEALGTHSLHLGDGYQIHGTHDGNRDSVGTAASHGCVRMYNEDLGKLYALVDKGTKVYIY